MKEAIKKEGKKKKVEQKHWACSKLDPLTYDSAGICMIYWTIL